MRTVSYLLQGVGFGAGAWLVLASSACGGNVTDGGKGGGSGAASTTGSQSGVTGPSSGVAGGTTGATSGVAGTLSGASGTTSGASAGSSTGATTGGATGATTGASGATAGSGTTTGSSGAMTGSSGAAGTATDAGVTREGGTRPPDAGQPVVIDGGPPFSGPTTNGTVAINRATTMGRLGPGFAGFSFEKTHMTDGFFTGTNAPLIALFKLLGPGVLRIGANDSDNCTWLPTQAPVAGGSISFNIGTADVDALAAFLSATGWKTIYAVSIKTATTPSAQEAAYAQTKLGASLHSIEIGNELDLMGQPYTTERPIWESFETAIRGLAPNVPFTGPASFNNTNGFTVPFARDEASKIVLLSQHYYRGSAGSGNATMATLLAPDPNVITLSQTLAAAAQANAIRDGFRWDEMNSYSSHGQAGVSDAFGSALWSIDFMLTTAEYGSSGVNFHGGGQNMDNNPCTTGPMPVCQRPFRYSPIDEVNSQVTAAAPLFYGMLFVAQAGVGNMVATTARAGALNFTGYSVLPASGGTNVILVNKDATNGVNATVDVGVPVTAADATYLQAQSLTATSGVTFGGAGITPAGAWNPQPPFALAHTGNTVTVLVPPASAVLVHAR